MLEVRYVIGEISRLSCLNFNFLRLIILLQLLALSQSSLIKSPVRQIPPFSNPPSNMDKIFLQPAFLQFQLR